jgi:hypothetical protein
VALVIVSVMDNPEDGSNAFEKEIGEAWRAGLIQSIPNAKIYLEWQMVEDNLSFGGINLWAKFDSEIELSRMVPMSASFPSWALETAAQVIMAEINLSYSPKNVEKFVSFYRHILSPEFLSQTYSQIRRLAKATTVIFFLYDCAVDQAEVEKEFRLQLGETMTLQGRLIVPISCSVNDLINWKKD